jgi:hypothetical protein
MKHHTSFLIAAMTVFPATASFADVTPEEVWDNWQLFGTSMGQSIEARLEQNGDTLIAHDVVMGMSAISGDFMSLEGTIPKIIFAGKRGGTVEITIPEPITYTTSIKADTTRAIAPLDLRSTATFDSTLIASGSAANMTYEILSGTMTYVTEKQVKDGIALVPEQIVTALGIQGTMTQSKDGDMITTDMDIEAEAVSVLSDGTTDDMTNQSSFKAAPVSVSGNFTNSMTALDDQMGYLKSLNGTGIYNIGNTVFETTTGTAAQMMHIVGETQEASIAATLSDGSLNYTGSSSKTEIVADGSAIPFPQVDFGIGRAEFGVTLPYLASAEAKPAGIKLSLENLRLPDIAWMMLDPQGQMPHDPATLRLDLSGNMVSDIDLLNPQVMLDMAEDTKMPVQPIDLTLNELFLSVAGATLSGSGEALFAQRPVAGMTALPFETANATLTLTGGNALIDTLAQTGLIQPQMSMTAKLMLGMFARQDEGADSYISDIEITQDGALTVNGQPLPF